MRPLRRRLHRLATDETGTPYLEFAIVLPVAMLLILGIVNFGLDIYLRAVLEGAMAQAGRDSSLQSAQAGQGAIDAQVTQAVTNILPHAMVSFTRKNYYTYSDIGQPEDFTDANNNGKYDPGECFEDMNGNGIWDSDVGASGIGGANDVVYYTATVSYPPLIPGGAAFGLPVSTSMSATTTLRNQPFADQAARTPVQICGTPSS